MTEKLSKFFRILDIELIDLEEGLDAYRKAGDERFQNKEITEYVHKENNALLKREIFDIGILREKIQAIAYKDFRSLNEASREVVSIIQSFTGVPNAVHLYMERKVDKVLHYITDFS